MEDKSQENCQYLEHAWSKTCKGHEPRKVFMSHIEEKHAQMQGDWIFVLEIIEK